MIRLYGFEGCPYCEELKGYYDKEGIEYDFVDIMLEENEEESNKLFKITGEESVPVILIGRTILAPEKSFKSIEEAFEITKKFLNE